MLKNHCRCFFLSLLIASFSLPLIGEPPPPAPPPVLLLPSGYIAPDMSRKTAGLSSSIKGLNYLSKNQNEDGSWGKEPSCRVGLSSVAILAYLSCGETPSSERYGKTIINGLKKLIVFADERTNAKSPETLWEACENGMLLWALSESYAITRIPQLEKPGVELLKKIVAEQNHLGLYKDKTENDFLVMAFCIIGIKAFFLGGNKGYPDIQELIEDKIIPSLKKDYVLDDGSFSRKKGANAMDFTATCLGTYCLQLLGLGGGASTKAGLKLIENFKFSNGKSLSFDWDNPPDPEFAPLAWFAMSNVLYQGHCGVGPVWKAWSKEFFPALLKKQDKDGSYPCLPGKRSDVLKDSDEKLWNTGLLVLTYESMHQTRWLPTFKPNPGEKKPDAAELGIKIE